MRKSQDSSQQKTASAKMHTIRNLLTGITLSAELLLGEAELTASNKKSLKLIFANSKKIKALLDSLKSK